MSGGIFVNYRRGDDPGFTGRLFDQLTTAFPRDKLFMDVDGIAPGADFTEVLKQEVDKCDVLLAVVGRNWLEATDAAGRRRLDDADDFVRIEIAAALAAGKLVVPVLVNGAEMPPSSALPSDIKAFSVRNAVRLTHERFHADSQGLIKSLAAAVADADNKRVADARLSAEKAAAKRRSDEAASAQTLAREHERAAAAKIAVVRPPVDVAPKSLTPVVSPEIAADARLDALGGVPRQWLLVAAGAVAIVLAIVVVGVSINQKASPPNQSAAQPKRDCDTGNVKADFDCMTAADPPKEQAERCDQSDISAKVTCEIEVDRRRQDAEREKIKRDLNTKLFGIKK